MLEKHYIKKGEQANNINKRRANGLNGKEWIRHSISIWDNISKDSTEKKVSHPAVYPYKLAHKIIQTFTNKYQKIVIDPFLGSGSTLLACSLLDKQGIGFDINSQYIKIAKERLKKILCETDFKEKTLKFSKMKFIPDSAENIKKIRQK